MSLNYRLWDKIKEKDKIDQDYENYLEDLKEKEENGSKQTD